MLSVLYKKSLHYGDVKYGLDILKNNMIDIIKGRGRSNYDSALKWLESLQ